MIETLRPFGVVQVYRSIIRCSSPSGGGAVYREAGGNMPQPPAVPQRKLEPHEADPRPLSQGMGPAGVRPAGIREPLPVRVRGLRPVPLPAEPAARDLRRLSLR